MAEPLKVKEVTPQEAVEQYAAALKGKESEAEAHLNLGTAYFAAHQYDEAIREFETVVRLKDDLYHAHYYLGALYSRAGKTDQARKALERAAQSDNFMLKAQARARLSGLLKG